MLHTYIKYHSADPCSTYIMYNSVDVRWHVLNNIMSQYYLHYCRVFGLNGVKGTKEMIEVCIYLGLLTLKLTYPAAPQVSIQHFTRRMDIK